MTSGREPYGPTLMEHFRRPRNQGELPGATLVHEGFNPLCGDRIRIQMAIRDGRVSDVRFTANACAIAVATASLLTEQIRGLSVGDVLSIREDEVVASFGSAIPSARRSCAVLPLATIVAALASA